MYTVNTKEAFEARRKDGDHIQWFDGHNTWQGHVQFRVDRTTPTILQDKKSGNNLGGGKNHKYGNYKYDYVVAYSDDYVKLFGSLTTPIHFLSYEDLEPFSVCSKTETVEPLTSTPMATTSTLIRDALNKEYFTEERTKEIVETHKYITAVLEQNAKIKADMDKDNKELNDILDRLNDGTETLNIPQVTKALEDFETKRKEIEAV